MKRLLSSRRTKDRNRVGGFTLGEVMVSMAIFSAVSIGILIAFSSLQRSFAAITRYSVDNAAQQRLSDYLAMDLRRSISVGTLGTTNSITMVIPRYAPTAAASPAPTPYSPQLDGSGGVYYSPSTKPSGTAISAWPASNYTVTVSYYLSEGKVYRQQDNGTPVALADNVEDFVFVATAADLDKVIETRITFRPTFRSSGPSTQVVAATMFHNRSLLRNNVTVY